MVFWRSVCEKTVVFITLSLYMLALYPMAVEAKTAIGVTPGKLEFSTHAGKSITATITLSNAGDEPSTIRSYVADYLRKPNGNVKFLPPGQSKWSCAKWIKVRPDNTDLNIGEAKKVNCSIKVPRNAGPGQYWAVVLFETTATKGKEVAVSGRVGTIVSLNITSPQSDSGSRFLPWAYILAGALTAILIFVLAGKWLTRRRKEE